MSSFIRLIFLTSVIFVLFIILSVKIISSTAIDGHKYNCILDMWTGCVLEQKSK